jgi:hypothetical protein
VIQQYLFSSSFEDIYVVLTDAFTCLLNYEPIENALFLEDLEVCVDQCGLIQGPFLRLSLYPRGWCIAKPTMV